MPILNRYLVCIRKAVKAASKCSSHLIRQILIHQIHTKSLIRRQFSACPWVMNCLASLGVGKMLYQRRSPFPEQMPKIKQKQNSETMKNKEIKAHGGY